MATAQDVVNFLVQWKTATSNYIDFVPRSKNIDTLSRLGININYAKTILKSLTQANYLSGPEADYDRIGDQVWCFGTTVAGMEIYIKVKIYQDATGKPQAKCLSFHETDRPLQYPHGEKL